MKCQEQREELRAWRKANPKQSKKQLENSKKLKAEKQIAAAIKKGIENKEKEAEAAKAEEEQTKAFIMSLAHDVLTEEVSKTRGRVTISDTATPATRPPSVTLKSILKRASAGKS